MTDIVPAQSNLPALPTPHAASVIDGGDVQLPRLKVGQPQSQQVIDDKVAKGSIFSTVGSDDEYPEELLPAGDETGLLVHVLGLRKGKSLTVDNELHTWEFNDPEAPAEARVTYDYALYLPEVEDNEVPYRFLMTSTATSTAKRINTLLKRNEARGPAYELAFRITTKLRKAEKNGQKFQWYVPVVEQVDADAANVEAAARLAGMIAGTPAASESLERSAGSEPAI